MNFQNLLNQFTGTNQHGASKAKNGMTKGLIGGAAAGGVLALLASNKSARKFAGKAAKVGGATLIGGIAFKAYRNWQRNNGQHIKPKEYSGLSNQTIEDQGLTEAFQLTLVKAMISAAKSDGHVDEHEQKQIFEAVKKMDLSTEMRGLVFDLLQKPIYIEELLHGAENLEQRAEIYLASCLAIDIDTAAEHSYLEKLSAALKLPADLKEQLRVQANYSLNNQETALFPC